MPMKRIILIIFLTLLVFSNDRSKVELVILGIVQDGGSPHIACRKNCCSELYKKDLKRYVVSLGIIDYISQKKYIFEATPDFPSQIKRLHDLANFGNDIPDGVFLTHAHIGHYTGLMYLGREAKGAFGVKVFAMERMKKFLEENAPWSQLVSLKNIIINKIQNDRPIKLSSNIKVVALQVPHRDEFSETVGFKIYGKKNSLLFIPDIDKWGKWERSIVDEIAKVDYALIDATFYSGEELDSRDISEIPHPFVIESMELFSDLPAKEKNKIYFIHLNHTNPLLDNSSEEYKNVLKKGYNVAKLNQKFEL